MRGATAPCAQRVEVLDVFNRPRTPCQHYRGIGCGGPLGDTILTYCAPAGGRPAVWPVASAKGIPSQPTF